MERPKFTDVLPYVQRLVLLMIALIVSESGDVFSDDRPNVILMMADDLGWGDTGYQGNPIIQTPNLDAMSRQGLRFSRFYAAAPVCSPTRGSCLTGRHPYRYGVYTANRGHLRSEEICLAELLKDHGYVTGHFGKWHLGTLLPDYSGKGRGRDPQANYCRPSSAGFDEWFSTEYAVATWNPYAPEHFHGNRRQFDLRALFWHNGQNVTQNLSGCDSRIIMDQAIPFIENAVNNTRPFFAVIWFHAPHAPVVGGPPYLAKYAEHPEEKRHYYAVVTALDEQVGRVRAKLQELGVARDTMLWFCSDNGPEGNPEPKGRSWGSAGPFRGRKRSLYEGGVRVPALLEWPRKIPQSRTIEMPCVTSDYFPTVAEIVGRAGEQSKRGSVASPADGRPYDGVSLLPLIEGAMKTRPRPIGFQTRQQASWVETRYKLVANLSSKRPRSDNGNAPFEAWELYDLWNDVGETQNLAAQHPDRVERMKEQLSRWRTSCESSDEGSDYPTPNSR